MGGAVLAELTVTFIGLKQGMFTFKGPVCCGEIVFDGLNVPSAAYEKVRATTQRVDAGWLSNAFPPRQRDAHKGHFGHVLVVGGNNGFGGAVMMAAQAAGRVGAGLVSVATRPAHVTALLTRCPEVMVHGVESGEALQSLLARASVIVIGPGFGQDEWSRQLLNKVLATDVPLVVDADALNLLAQRESDLAYRENWIMTPHPGEAARLLACSTAEVQSDRFAAVRGLQQQYGGVALLKGNGTLVAGMTSSSIKLCCGG
ncbi:YjeF protein2C function unknown [gamma proteobacterium IMCC2047]|nr:YjeF protein2C function unknown [gamma proteobacterium IMCC2047]